MKPSYDELRKAFEDLLEHCYVEWDSESNQDHCRWCGAVGDDWDDGVEMAHKKGCALITAHRVYTDLNADDIRGMHTRLYREG